MSASPRQRDFINTLLRERVVPEAVQAQIQALLMNPDASPREHISPIIDQLMRMPKKTEARATVARPNRWDGIEKSKYAVPATDIPLGSPLRDALGGNDHLFFEVREYMERMYMRQLHGAPGSFSRTKFTWQQVDEALNLIRGNCLEYSQLFGSIYTCCGVCGAELTDRESRRLKLGPECRKRFGL